MRPLLTAEEMRELDRRTIEEMGVPGIVLMENAGRAVAEVVMEHLEGVESPVVCILAGRGNNGGDGLVVARHLHQKGVEVEVFLFGQREQVQGDARTNLEAALRIGIPITFVTEPASLEAVRLALQRATLAVDALLGTGSQGAPRGLLAEAVRLLNKAAVPVIAVDLPTGIDSDTGAVPGEAVEAKTTVTFGCSKVGLHVFPGAAFAGQVKVADIGIPPKVVQALQPRTFLTTPSLVRALLPPRPRDAHKGTFGHALIVAGSTGMTGAAMLAAQAAARSGSGLVTLAIPEPLNPILETALPEILTAPLPAVEEKGYGFAEEAAEAAAGLLVRKTAVAVGPGLGQREATRRFLLRFLPQVTLPLVLDADGLNLLASQPEVLQSVPGPVIITPHPGELGRWLQRSAAEIQAHRLEAAREAAARWRVVVVLKGAGTIIAHPEGRAFVNPTGNPGMASGGTGDVLTGILAGLLAQGLPPFEAAIAGVYLHGLAGDWAALRCGEASLLAGDLLKHLPEAWQWVESGRAELT